MAATACKRRVGSSCAPRRRTITRQSWAIAVGIALIIAPHLIGAPQPPTHESGVPAGLAAEFAANSIAAPARVIP